MDNKINEANAKTEVLQNEIEVFKCKLLLTSGDPLSIDKLIKEENIYKYIDLLKSFSFRYTVIILAYDTPTGPGFTAELSNKLKSLGLNVDLSDKFRMAYIAILDSGTCAFEQVEPDLTKTLTVNGAIGGSKIELVSAGWRANCAKSHIIINSKSVPGLSIGLNFVVMPRD